MEIVIPAKVLTSLGKVQKADRRRILDAIQQVADAHPQRLSFVTELVGTIGAWRLRKGDWRVIYEITDEVLTVRAIGHRREIYE